jgi:ligand-binding SRPBCC domain-containing protein
VSVYFECVTRTTVDRAVLFDLSRSIDAHAASLARSRERAVAGVTTGLISLDQHVTWRAWHLGLPIRMTSRITDMSAPDLFVVEQVRGPFRSFRHAYEFEEDGGQTVMTERVEFAAPFGVLGRAVERLVLARYMSGLVRIRNEYLLGDALVSFDA